MGHFKTILDATSCRVSEVLPNYGFGGEPHFESGAAFRRVWSREIDWKSDAIEIVYRRGGELSLLVNFSVWVPYPADGEPVFFDAKSIPTPLIPWLRWNWITKRYVEKVVCAVRDNIGWFDSFASPECCLDSLNNPDRNGPRSGPALDAMLEHLRSVSGIYHTSFQRTLTRAGFGPLNSDR